MGKEVIVERIISDAEEEARAIIGAAEEKAALTDAEACRRAERRKAGEEAEVGEKVKGILDGKAATARLDCAKILLGEKRKVIDAVYERALKKLIALDKSETIGLAEKLLKQYAEQGDEIAFAVNFRYASDVASLPVVKEKNLKVSTKLADGICGGFMLIGKSSDKNLSYEAILAADREERQADLAAQIFING